MWNKGATYKCCWCYAIGPDAIYWASLPSGLCISFDLLGSLSIKRFILIFYIFNMVQNDLSIYSKLMSLTIEIAHHKLLMWNANLNFALKIKFDFYNLESFKI